MDPELIAYLDARFREVSQQITGLREETHHRFEQVDRRFEQVDRRFEQIDRRFEQIDRRFEEVDRQFEEVNQRFEQAADTARQTLVLVEGLRHDMQIIAEGLLGLNERVERTESIDTRLVSGSVENRIAPYYRELDGRVRTLEGWADRQRWEVMDGVRRLLGRPPLGPPSE